MRDDGLLLVWLGVCLASSAKGRDRAAVVRGLGLRGSVGAAFAEVANGAPGAACGRMLDGWGVTKDAAESVVDAIGRELQRRSVQAERVALADQLRGAAQLGDGDLFASLLKRVEGLTVTE